MPDDVSDTLADGFELRDDERLALQDIVGARLGVVITGEPGSGKSALTSALCGLVPSRHRILVVADDENFDRYSDTHDHAVVLRADPARSSGTDAASLIRRSADLRANFLVVDEMPGHAVHAFLLADGIGRVGVLPFTTAEDALRYMCEHVVDDTDWRAGAGAAELLVSNAVQMVVTMRHDAESGTSVVDAIDSVARGWDRLAVRPLVQRASRQPGVVQEPSP